MFLFGCFFFWFLLFFVSVATQKLKISSPYLILILVNWPLLSGFILSIEGTASRRPVFPHCYFKLCCCPFSSRSPKIRTRESTFIPWMSSRTTLVVLQTWNLDININMVPIIFHIRKRATLRSLARDLLRCRSFRATICFHCSFLSCCVIAEHSAVTWPDITTTRTEHFEESTCGVMKGCAWAHDPPTQSSSPEPRRTKGNIWAFWPHASGILSVIEVRRSSSLPEQKTTQREDSRVRARPWLGETTGRRRSESRDGWSRKDT